MENIKRYHKMVQPVYNIYMHFCIPSREAAEELISKTIHEMTNENCTKEECEAVTDLCEKGYVRREYAKKALYAFILFEILVIVRIVALEMLF